MTTIPLSIPRPTHPTGVWSWLTTVDHKRIGILYGVTAVVLFLTGGIEAMIMRPPAFGRRPGHRERRGVQPALHNARHHDDLSGDHADGRRLLQFRHTASDRRAGRSISAAERLQLLDVPVRGNYPQVQLVHGRRDQRRLVRLRAAHRPGGQPGQRHRPLDHQPAGAGDRVAGGGLQLHRDHNQHARPRHVSDAYAAFHLDDAGDGHTAGVGLPGDYRRAHRAYVRPRIRDQLLRGGQRREPRAVAAPVLGVRTPRGVHSDSAGHGHSVGDPPHLLQEATLRLLDGGAGGRDHRVHGLDGLEPSHVHGGAWPGRHFGVYHNDYGDSRAHRHQDI